VTVFFPFDVVDSVGNGRRVLANDGAVIVRLPAIDDGTVGRVEDTAALS
jgi:hypothetical protein